MGSALKKTYIMKKKKADCYSTSAFIYIYMNQNRYVEKLKYEEY